MTDTAITSVVLCGGSGTRLWPLSRKSFPKQFVPLVGGKSLLALTFERVSALGTRVVVVASEEHRFLVTEAAQGLKGNLTVLLEPVARNTAAAMALAAIQAMSDTGPETLLLFCPADHHIPDAAAFSATVSAATAAATEGLIVTFGVVPTFPSTAYGYIEKGTLRSDGAFNVARFIEKPPVSTAQQLLLTGSALWNAGIFLCRADSLLSALGLHAPDILTSCKAAWALAQKEGCWVRPDKQAFVNCRSQSIDYAVMERHASVSVMPFGGAWSDVGSWSAMAELCPPDPEGNRIEGKGLAHHASDTYIHAPHRLVVALGTHDLLIIDTPDALLVAKRDCAEQVKEVVARLEGAHKEQASTHRKVARPWGWYDSLDLGDRFQVKRIGVKPGASLSLQKHHHRAEHWIVVKGTAEVTRGEETFLLSENQSTYIPIGETHRLRNPGKLELEIIEVQSGSYLGEDDIVRLEDTYGRS